MIVDEKTVISGSFNWTKSAKKKNLELIIVEKNIIIVNDYLQLYNDLWEKAEADNE